MAEKVKRSLAIVMSVVLVIGLMPMISFGAVDDAWAGDLTAASVSLPRATKDGYDTDQPVRKLYTRNVMLTGDAPDGENRHRTVPIDVRNPVYEGATIAVRFSGVTPFIEFYHGRSWRGSTRVNEGNGAQVVDVEGVPGQKVLYCSWDVADAAWEAKNGEGGYGREFFAVFVGKSETGICEIEEISMIGGAERIDPTASSSYVERIGMSAQEITRAMESGYNMANHLESHWDPDNPQPDGGWSRSDLELESHWSRGTYITRDTIRNLKKQGLKSVRLPTTWYQHIYPKGEPAGDPGDSAKYGDWSLTDRYHIDEAWMDRVQEVVDWCVAEDLFVILNIHHEDWLNCDNLHQVYNASDRLPSEFEAVWMQIGDRFKDYDQHLILEGMNEPHSPYVDKNGKEKFGVADENSVAMVNRLNADFVSLMRSDRYAGTGNATRMLMVTTDNESGEIAYTGYVMPDDPASCLAQSVHCYSPHSWTHYLQGKDASVTGEDNVYTQQMRGDVDSAWEGIRSKWTSKGIPVVIGEFGCYYFGESREQDRVDWMTQFATHAKELGCPMLFWRMDRVTERDEDGWEHVIWTSGFDEEQQKICDCSADMFAEWFSIMDDGDVEWGSEAEVCEGEHVSPDDASADQLTDVMKEKGFTELPATLVSRAVCRGTDPETGQEQDTGHWRVRLRGVTWERLEGNEVVIRFTGNTPRLLTLKGSSGDWWGISASSVSYNADKTGGVAYFSASAIKANWEGRGESLDSIDNIGVCAADSGDQTAADAAIETIVEQVSIVHRHAWGKWVQAEAPACTAEGVATKVCAHDANHVLTRSVSALGHAWQADYTVDKPATHATAGSKSIHCERCGAVKPGSEVGIPKLAVPQAKLKKLKAGKRSFTAKWARVAGVSGYQLQYSLKKSFKKAKTVTVKKATAASKKVKKLKAGKKYRVRIRSFVTAGGTKCYSAWSKAKAVKVR